MRNLFFILLILIAGLAFLNLEYIPARQSKGKEIIDRHLHSLPLASISEISYVGKISVLSKQARVESVHIKADYAKWKRIQYADITLEIKSIDYNPTSLFVRGVREIESIDEITFQGTLAFDETTTYFSNEFDDFVNPLLRSENGRLLMRTFIASLNNKYDLEGDFILTPTGDLKFRIQDVYGVDISDPVRSTVKIIAEEFSDLTIPVEVMDTRIALNEIEVVDQMVRFSGKSETVQE